MLFWLCRTPRCSGSSGGASAGGDCELTEPCSSNDLSSFDSDSDISSGREVTSLLNLMKIPRAADMNVPHSRTSFLPI